MVSRGVDTPAAETVVRDPAWSRYGAWVVCPLLGAGLLLLLNFLSGRLASTSWVPWQPAFELASSVPEPWAVPGAAVLGSLAGLGLAVFIAVDGLTVTVGTEAVRLKRRGTTQRVERAPVSAVFLEGNALEKRLVLLDSAGGELARQKCDASEARLAEVFREYSFPWRDGDPYEGEYRLWVPDTPALDSGANAVFADRRRALDKDKSGDAAALRTELGKMGVVVRDEKKRQYWRRTSDSSG